MIPKDANGVAIKDGDRWRMTGTIVSTSDGRSVHIRPDRQPEGFEILPFIDPRVIEVSDGD